MTESAHQRAVFKWTQQPHVRHKYPELKLLFHVKNETTEGAARVASDKSMGVRPGVPDLCLPVPKGNYHSLWLEMKNEKGRPSEAQKWWIKELNLQGCYAAICHGWEEAVRVLEDYLDERL